MAPGREWGGPAVGRGGPLHSLGVVVNEKADERVVSALGRFQQCVVPQVVLRVGMLYPQQLFSLHTLLAPHTF